MDFKDTPEEAAYRGQVRTWLETHGQRRRSADQVFGEGLDDAAKLAAAKAWQARKARAGYAAITWPKEMGGQGGTAMQEVIYKQEEAAYLVPRMIFENSLGQCLPTIATWALPELKARHLAKGIAGDEIWCQLFSEPAAGSDTGGIRTRAEKQGDHWVINGQKAWTSGAHFCDYGILLARSDWDKPKQEGLTMFILDMKAPGVAIRPIHQMSGESEFNEVFLNDVRIADTHRLGPECGGWKVMLSTLMHERLAVGGHLPTDLHTVLIDLARKCQWNGKPAIEDARVRAHVADAFLLQHGVELIIARGLTALSKGKAPGPEMSITKLVAAKAMQDISSFALELAGPEGALSHESIGQDWNYMQRLWLGAPGARVAGGTDEVMKNVIAERVLGMPGEIRTDRKIPFREL
ncbi:MAG: acyl-CoA dehydrogenase family protein [Rhodocyclaceae bacterium]|nr:acyl-CoA dehydrogenase family protein [Rhodocyclaceae bacterium]MBK6675608.1 acyl-CoA dehydrogenase family protein [Rhodocyclaceae bacterium]MBK9312003.1 acyl-CoA dehydrogenase family protein [Rhodocyclaceae bacterium]MBK9953685.1 acyl-CoA dehydrogenase family protein [Rhodocyclaceae bacterium]